MAQDIVFRGLTAPLRLHGAEAVLALLARVVVGWPYEICAEDPTSAPFFSISATPDARLFLCQSHVEPKPALRLDPVNALCDAMAALALALPAEDQGLICLHAAAVAMAGQLVVFPGVRRAGKSTLAVALAKAGHGLYSDDVLPLSITAHNVAQGHAMGIAPRLRLPLPDTLPAGFRDWAEAKATIRNRQYSYLNLPGQPAQGAALPIGAFVILDRQNVFVPARLSQVAPDVAMDALLHQNFTRDRHSADVLQVMAATLSDRPVFRLSYWGLDDAVACLEAVFQHWPKPAPPAGPGAAVAFRMADFSGDLPAGSGGSAIRQRKETLAQTIGDTLYLADTEGRAIHRMDRLAAAIWEVLAEPMTPQSLETLLTDAFPRANSDQIAADLQGLLHHFAKAGLIEADSPT
jgi:hypothetical protein